MTFKGINFKKSIEQRNKIYKIKILKAHQEDDITDLFSAQYDKSKKCSFLININTTAIVEVFKIYTKFTMFVSSRCKVGRS